VSGSDTYPISLLVTAACVADRIAAVLPMQSAKDLAA
jgi:hypothetical protein